MKNILLLFIVTQFNLAVKAQDKSLSKHVVLISIGFRPEFYLDEKWPAPNLKSMAKRTYALGFVVYFRL
jgi:hypothetical protein